MYFVRRILNVQYFPYTIFQAEPTWKRFFLPGGFWLPQPLRSRFGAFFSSYRSKSLLHVVPLSNFAVIMASAANPSPEYCNIQFGFLFSFFALSAFAQIVLQPYRSKAESCWSVASLLTLGCVVALQIATLKRPDSLSPSAKPTVLMLQTFVVFSRSVHHLLLTIFEFRRWRHLEPAPKFLEEEEKGEEQELPGILLPREEGYAVEVMERRGTMIASEDPLANLLRLQATTASSSAGDIGVNIDDAIDDLLFLPPPPLPSVEGGWGHMHRVTDDTEPSLLMRVAISDNKPSDGLDDLLLTAHPLPAAAERGEQEGEEILEQKEEKKEEKEVMVPAPAEFEL